MSRQGMILLLDKLLDFMEKPFFDAIPELSGATKKAVAERMKDGKRLDDCDVIELKLFREGKLSVFTANEHPHNGSFFDVVSEEIEAPDEMLQLAIDILRNRAHNKVLTGFVLEQSRAMELRVQARLKELGLL